jgi:hypothetical protein
LNGTGFVSDSVVNWNSVALATTFVNSSQLTALVPASDIATAGTASVTVASPGPGGGTSNVVFFDIVTPVVGPTFTELPSSPPGSSVSPITADFNADGKLDLVYLAGGINIDNLILQLGSGDGSFQTPVTYSVGAEASTPAALVAGDFNGGGKLDLPLPMRSFPRLTIQSTTPFGFSSATVMVRSSRKPHSRQKVQGFR